MQEDLKNALEYLNKGKVILYPTDTIWGLGCDATREESVKKIFKIKKREESKSLIILVNSMEMLKKYIKKFPSKVTCVLNGTSRPTSVIYKNPVGLAKPVIADNNTVAIRIVKDKFCYNLIQEFGKPLVSTSANYSGKSSPRNFDDIDKNLMKEVDYIVSLYQNRNQNSASQIVMIDDHGKINFLRK
jgi:L-threonylcarbamoyladenylate synthase